MGIISPFYLQFILKGEIIMGKKTNVEEENMDFIIDTAEIQNIKEAQ